MSGIAMSRIMLPDDANPGGNIHGGVTLELMSQAGYIATSRHCSAVTHSEDRSALTVGLARVSHINFYEPMYVGNVAELQAAVTYTSPRSMEVTVDVWAENLKSGRKKCTNTGTLWYVALPSDVEALKRGEGLKPLLVPQLEGLSEEEREEGRRRYEAQKASRKSIEASLGLDSVHPLSRPWFPHNLRDIEEHTVPASQTTLNHIVHPSNCTTTGFLTGGTLMKLMDEAAAICAMRHTKEVAVTACIDAIDFHCPVMNGEVLCATARLLFTSGRTMEIEVCVEAEGFMTKRRVTSSAYFTYVSLGEGGHAAVVPPLKLLTEEERERFEEGRRRYEARKKLREKK